MYECMNESIHSGAALHEMLSCVALLCFFLSATATVTTFALRRCISMTLRLPSTECSIWIFSLFFFATFYLLICNFCFYFFFAVTILCFVCVFEWVINAVRKKKLFAADLYVLSCHAAAAAMQWQACLTWSLFVISYCIYLHCLIFYIFLIKCCLLIWSFFIAISVYYV